MSEATETKERISFKQTPDGKMIFTEPNGQTHECLSPQIAAQIAEVEMSAAAKRLQSLKNQRGPRILPYTIDEEDWFLKRMGFPELTRFSLLSGANSNGEIDLTGEGATTSLTAAALFCGLALASDDPTPYFDSMEQAIEFADEPEATVLVSILFDEIAALNPTMLPTKKKQKAKPKRTLNG